MPVEFTVRTDQLKNALKQLKIGRDKFAETDFAHPSATGTLLKLTAVGTETTIAANGKQTGTLRLPLKTLTLLVEAAKWQIAVAFS